MRSTFVHREDGERNTTDGLTSMFRRHCIAAKVSDFGLRDLRAKGATDEYRAGRLSSAIIRVVFVPALPLLSDHALAPTVAMKYS